MSVWVDPRQFLRLFLSRRLKRNCKEIESLPKTYIFLIPKSLLPDVVNSKLTLFDPIEFKVWNI